jgi:hypothetical protein
VVLNAQVVIGFNPQPDHWHRTQFLIVFVSAIFLLFLAHERYLKQRIGYLNESLPKLSLGKAAMWVIVGAVLVVQLYSQYVFSTANADTYTLDPDYEASYKWLSLNTPEGAVVGTIAFATNNELQLHTYNKLFLPNGLNTLASSDEIWKRYMILSSIHGVDMGDFADSIKPGSRALAYLFHNQYRSDSSLNSYLRGGVVAALSGELFAKKTEQYKEYVTAVASVENIPYRLDYLLYGPREGVFGNDPSEKFSDVEKVYEENKVIIYKITTTRE